MIASTLGNVAFTMSMVALASVAAVWIVLWRRR